MDLSRPAELRARRLIAQALAPTAARPQPGTVAEVIRWMGAVQGQTYDAGIRALGLRAGHGEEAVLKAVAGHEVVRCWPQRGTLHFIPTADARWMLRLGNPRVPPVHRHPFRGARAGSRRRGHRPPRPA